MHGCNHSFSQANVLSLVFEPCLSISSALFPSLQPCRHNPQPAGGRKRDVMGRKVGSKAAGWDAGAVPRWRDAPPAPRMGCVGWPWAGGSPGGAGLEGEQCLQHAQLSSVGWWRSLLKFASFFFSIFFLVWLSREGHQKRVVNGVHPSFLVLCWTTPKFHFLKTHLSLSALLTAPLGANVPD